MRFLKIVFWIVIIFVVVWVAASIVDIMLHNLDEHPTYQWWNLIDMYHGTWVRVDDQIKRWTDIKNKFENNA